MAVGPTPEEMATGDTLDATPRALDEQVLRGIVKQRLFGGDLRSPTIGRFEAFEKLGEGGMGQVYAARDPKLRREVAVKLLLRADSRDPETAKATARLVREAQAMARLSHPNVLPVFEVGEHEERIFIAMELVRGQTLGSWLAEAPRTVPEILDAFTQAGRGLVAAHEAGLVHRDFKPDNVLIGRDGRVRVMDFGLARPTGAAGPTTQGAKILEDTADDAALTRTGALLGTPAYMSPEQWSGEPADSRSDQFSFCVALWEALFDHRPFVASTLPQLAAKVLHDQPERPPDGPDVAPTIEAALRRGLAKDPDERFATLAELLARLQPEPPAPPRRTLSTAVTLVAVAAGLGGVLYGAWPTAESPPASPEVQGIEEPEAGAEPAPPPAPSSPRPWTARRLARTSGRVGATSATVDPALGWLAYFDDFELWYLDLAGGQPHALAGFRGWSLIAGSADGRMLLFQGDQLQWVDAKGHATPLPHPIAQSSTPQTFYPEEVSPDGKYLLARIRGRAIVQDLETGAIELDRRREDTYFDGNWSADGRTLALVSNDVRQRGASVSLMRTDGFEEGPAHDIETFSTIMLGTDSLALQTFTHGRPTGILECQRIDLVIGDCATRALVGEGYGGGWGAGPLASGGHAFAAFSGGCSVLRVPLDGDDDPWESSDAEIDDQRMTVLDDGAVLFSTDRFGGTHTWVRSSSREKVAPEPIPALLGLDVLGTAQGAVLARARECSPSASCSLLRFDTLDAEPHPITTARWVATVGRLRCADAGPCAAFDREASEHLVIDPRDGAVLGRYPYTATSPYNWDISPDGRTLARLEVSTRRVDFLEIDSGEVRSTTLDEVFGFLRYDRASGDLYLAMNYVEERVIARMQADGTTRRVWFQVPGELVDFDITPDGKELVVELRSNHRDIWVVEPP